MFRSMKNFFLLIIVLLFTAAGQVQSQTQTILFFGDSITAGNGVAQKQAYPALIQQKIDSLGWDFEVINGGLSGETSAGGLRRIDWMLQKPVDLFVLELGGNDGLRGIDLSTTKQNLQAIIDKVQQTYPQAKIVLAGMKVPPNLGKTYTQQFAKMYTSVARKNDIPLIPFLLEGVAGKPALNQADEIHPNAVGHAIIAETVWEYIEPILRDLRKR